MREHCVGHLLWDAEALKRFDAFTRAQINVHAGWGVSLRCWKAGIDRETLMSSL